MHAISQEFSAGITSDDGVPGVLALNGLAEEQFIFTVRDDGTPIPPTVTIGRVVFNRGPDDPNNIVGAQRIVIYNKPASKVSSEVCRSEVVEQAVLRHCFTASGNADRWYLTKTLPFHVFYWDGYGWSNNPTDVSLFTEKSVAKQQLERLNGD